MTASNETLYEIVRLLDDGRARYEKLSHGELGFISDEVAKARAVELGQCSKAVVLKVKGSGVKRYVLAVLPGDRKVDTKRLGAVFGGKKASFVSAEEVLTLTSCVPGALAPFSLNPELSLVVDPSIFLRFSDIAFNAGTLTDTIVLNAEDYRNIVKPQEVSFVQAWMR